jgi:hypothetical protein
MIRTCIGNICDFIPLGGQSSFLKIELPILLNLPTLGCQVLEEKNIVYKDSDSVMFKISNETKEDDDKKKKEKIVKHDSSYRSKNNYQYKNFSHKTKNRTCKQPNNITSLVRYTPMTKNPVYTRKLRN